MKSLSSTSASMLSEADSDSRRFWKREAWPSWTDKCLARAPFISFHCLLLRLSSLFSSSSPQTPCVYTEKKIGGFGISGIKKHWIFQKMRGFGRDRLVPVPSRLLYISGFSFWHVLRSGIGKHSTVWIGSLWERAAQALCFRAVLAGRSLEPITNGWPTKSFLCTLIIVFFKTWYHSFHFLNLVFL